MGGARTLSKHFSSAETQSVKKKTLLEFFCSNHKSGYYNLSFGDSTARHLLHKFKKKIRMHKLFPLLLRYMVLIKGKDVFVATYTFVTA